MKYVCKYSANKTLIMIFSPGTEPANSSGSQTSTSAPKLCLTIKAPCLPGVSLFIFLLNNLFCML